MNQNPSNAFKNFISRNAEFIVIRRAFFLRFWTASLLLVWAVSIVIDVDAANNDTAPRLRQRAAFDFDGDGKTDIAVYRPSNGTWYLLQSTAGFAAAQFGVSSDNPVPADYDGDGRADIAVQNKGIWYLHGSEAGFMTVQLGSEIDAAIPATYLPTPYAPDRTMQGQ